MTQRNDFMSVMQQLMAERSRSQQLQQQLEAAAATAQQAQQASSPALCRLLRQCRQSLMRIPDCAVSGRHQP